MGAIYHEPCAQHRLLSRHYAASVAAEDWASIQCTAMRDALLTAARRQYRAPAMVCSDASCRPLTHWNYYAPASRRNSRRFLVQEERGRQTPGDASEQLTCSAVVRGNNFHFWG